MIEPSPFLEETPNGVQPDRRPANPMHRLLPSSPESEAAIISSILLDPARSLAICHRRMVSPEWFHIPSNRIIFETCLELEDEGQEFDFITLTERIREKKLLEAVGGPAHLTDLGDFPTAANIEAYIKIVGERFLSREMIRVHGDFQARAFDEIDEPEALLQEAEAKVLDIRRHMARGSDQISNRRAAQEAMESIEWRIENPRKIRGLSTGFPGLDRKTDGLHKQELIIIAARPSEGKTALAIQMAEYQAFDLSLPVIFYTLEMSRQQFLERWIYMRARVSPTDILLNGATADQVRKLRAAGKELEVSKVTLEDGEAMTIQQLRASARRLVREKKPVAIYIDSGSALKSDSKQASSSRTLEVADITVGLKGMAKELDIPVIVLWHLGRQVDKHGVESEPTLSDLRGGATVEQDADVVAMMIPKEGADGIHPVDIYLPKQRCAQRHARATLHFYEGYTLFHEDPPAAEQTTLL